MSFLLVPGGIIKAGDAVIIKTDGKSSYYKFFDVDTPAIGISAIKTGEGECTVSYV